MKSYKDTKKYYTDLLDRLYEISDKLEDDLDIIDLDYNKKICCMLEDIRGDASFHISKNCPRESENCSLYDMYMSLECDYEEIDKDLTKLYKSEKYDYALYNRLINNIDSYINSELEFECEYL